MNLLIVEDDARVADMLRRGLAAEGFTPDTAESGAAALARLGMLDYDLIILDLRLPDLDGVRLCQQIRDDDNATPILMLTARDRVEDRVAGLRAGADDYLIKPFAFEELLARLEAISRRRHEHPTEQCLRVGKLTLTPDMHEARCGDQPIALSAREFALLHCLMAGAPRVLSRTRLLERVWGPDADVTFNTVDVYIGYLRRKLGQCDAPPQLETVRGVGYRLVA